jgi:hypothetical protein
LKFNLKTYLFIISAAVLLFANNLFATHLVGGYISYEYKGVSSAGTSYLVTITAYRDCKPGSIVFSDDIDVCVYDRKDSRLYKSFNFPRTEIKKVDPIGRTDCPEATQVCLEKATFQRTIVLPNSAFGYFVKWEVCCRNEQVNLKNDQQNRPFIGQTYQATIPPSALKNSSPTFSDVPVPFICVNDTTELNNFAKDPDGDFLVYKLATPWYGASLSDNFLVVCQFIPLQFQLALPTIPLAIMELYLLVQMEFRKLIRVMG